jgi:hypothetical protein
MVPNYENFSPDFHDIIDMFFSALIFLALTFAPFLAGFTDFFVAMVFPPDIFIFQPRESNDGLRENTGRNPAALKPRETAPGPPP